MDREVWRDYLELFTCHKAQITEARAVTHALLLDEQRIKTPFHGIHIKLNNIISSMTLLNIGTTQKNRNL